MIALSTRGLRMSAAVLLLTAATPALVQAQKAVPITNSAVARLLAEHVLALSGVAEQPARRGVAAQRTAPGASVPRETGVARAAGGARGATEPTRASGVRLPNLRPGSTRSFLARQLEFPRVREAFASRADRVASLFRSRGVAAPEVFFRVFKREQVLEVWAKDRGGERFELLGTYPVCKVSGRLGPKTRQGDLQIPEGFYSIDLLNPWSNYHLSMRVDYPNAVDRARGGGGRPGGDIYIHGGCATIGCVPVTDEYIEELYVIAVKAREAGQERIPVHIFPTRLDTAGLAWLRATYGSNFVDYAFWENLQEGYLAFERSRVVPTVGYQGARYTFPLIGGERPVVALPQVPPS